jgi:N-acetylglucosamine-6-phosphate deacetylase
MPGIPRLSESQTQEKSLYPKLLHLLRPFSSATSATLLGWHAEGPFLEYTKRGAHAPPFLLSAPEGIKSFEDVYGEDNLVDKEDWLMSERQELGVRMITAAPEIPGVMDAIKAVTGRGIVLSIGHRSAIFVSEKRHCLCFALYLVTQRPMWQWLLSSEGPT